MIEAMPNVSASTGLHEILALLTSQLHPDANHKEDLVFLKDVFSEKSIGYLMKIHEKLKQYEKHSPTPVLHSASCLAEDLAEELQNGPLEDDEQELLLLLSTPHLKAVLSAHDTVAQKKFDPVLPPLPDDLDDDLEEESVKIVRLVKNKEPLGATIRRDEATGAVIVARIMRGGAADRSGLVHVGDELREVNGNLITHKRPDEISQILSQSQGSITLKIIPAVADDDKMKESKVYIRALFDYTPFEDKATPCQEAGLPFKRGDILQVVSQEDPTWWQAKRVGDCNLRAALVPSAQFQERRLRYRMKMGSVSAPISPKAPIYERADREDCDNKSAVNGKDIVSPKSKAAPAFCGHAFSWDFYSASLRRSFRHRKDRQGSPGEAHTPDANHTEFLIYEEVAQYFPRPGERPRLITLIGSLGARIAELKQKVIAENPRRYGLAVPHTTRARKSHEREGVEYHFISKAAFEADIQNGKFIEYGEYKENLYGTSLDSIHRVLDQNKVCLVDVQPEALKTLRTAEFKPYVIFVRPRIGDGQRKQFGSSSSLSVGVTDDDLQEMKQSAEQMDECYGHWVDYVLVKEDPASALAELQVVLEKVQMEPQWVPASWVRR
ncbi:MAGUK p55 subfamily member 3 isoform X1 [Oreochromis niloticus]|uniref:MAGUK p55 scaffold protein 3 n=2 Tax=Oreochromis niloticus TaxID=8128 RepID=I3KHY6_ORENI|nr:MAGUK p55 subfamily member 3 isoform X1 [Oreochromis niloticus]XP_025765513.1 MAGUK p55 subfamily member 3 isoform X1 [Oreochromis niloticus]XP_025765514.1 MAGUK p55 subfamily member 3 isoform X1 [Oreochromis niloticus]